MARASGSSIPCRRGFTLIELLVVVAILAILVSIMAPALQRVKATARALGCLSNLRKQSVAFISFGREHRGNVPICYSYPFPEGLGKYMWGPYTELMAGYPGNGYTGYSGQGGAYPPPAPMFVCPAVKDPAGNINDPMGVPGNSAYLHYSLCMWTTYYAPLYTKTGDPFPRTDMNEFADTAPFIPDTHSDGAWYLSRPLLSGKAICRDQYGNEVSPQDFCIAADSWVYWWKKDGFVRYRHDGRASALAIDGSARLVLQLNVYGYEILED